MFGLYENNMIEGEGNLLSQTLSRSPLRVIAVATYEGLGTRIMAVRNTNIVLYL